MNHNEHDKEIGMKMNEELIELQAEVKNLKLIAKELISGIISIDERIKGLTNEQKPNAVNVVDRNRGLIENRPKQKVEKHYQVISDLPKDKKKYVFYSDGGARENGAQYSVGGWACAFFDVDTGENLFEAADAMYDVTNNQMELFAAITALEALPSDRKCDVDAYLDSKYVIDGITSWVYGWVSKGWRTSGNKTVKNLDFWKRLYELNKRHNVNWIWVKGHNGNYGNEYVDTLINKKIDELINK